MPPRTPRTPTLSDLNAFAAVAGHRSFRRAAEEMGLAPSSLSHVMRGLERTLGVRLLNRTTRSVAPTEAGERLLARLLPALGGLEAALAEVDAFRAGPSGTLRINAPEAGARLLMRRAVPEFLARHPLMAVDLVTEGRLVDIVAEGFDAGVRLGEAVPVDMIAVRFGGPARFLAVASPGYLARRGVPAAPEDLAGHDCVRHRFPSGRMYRWEFERRGREVVVDVGGRVTLDDVGLMADAAAGGLGIAYVPEGAARAHLDAGTLVAVLEEWCPTIPGLFLYHPGRRQVPAGLAALIAVLREVEP